MISILVLAITLQGNNVTPVLLLSNGTENTQVSIFDSRQYGDISHGPQEYVVDFDECIYVHDINTLDTNRVNRILKFDSTGRFLFVINKQSVSSFDDAWFGPMTIDPNTNDLLILGSAANKHNEKIDSAQIPCLVFRFSPTGHFLGASEIKCSRASFFLYDYSGHFYAKNVDGASEFDNHLKYIRDIPKLQSKGHGYSQWAYWSMERSLNEYSSDDSKAGKFLINLRNNKTNTRLECVFYHPPHYCRNAYVEGLDRYGNLFLNAFKKTFVRLHPKSHKVALVNLLDIGIPKGCGDVRHAYMISPNGYLYQAMLFRNDEEELEYHVYRILPDMFTEIKCASIVEEKK